MEKTSKNIKKKMARAYVVFAIGMAMFSGSIILHNHNILPPMIGLGGFCILIVGICMIIVAGIKRWWCHG
jgi:uncharacterized membrane protein YgdD (TMEM256/DUF423 family)